MSMTSRGQRVAIGGARMGWDLRDMPAIAGQLDRSDPSHVFCLPRRMHRTEAMGMDPAT